MTSNDLIIGIDVGGTKIGAGLIQHNKIKERIKIPTGAKSGSRVMLQNIFKAVRHFRNEKISGIGVGIAGQVDFRKGIFYGGPNLPKNFKNVPLRELLEKKFKVPVKVDNDTHCFTLAESIYGAGGKYKNVLGITLGTGIGGGFCIDKKIYRGCNNFAAEIGHMKIGSEENFKCSCGRTGHWEALGSGTAMIKWYKKFTGKTRDTFFIEERAMRLDRHGLRAMEKMAESLGVGLANLIHILNPDVIVIGGGIVRVKILWPKILKETKKNIIFPEAVGTPILKTKLGDDAPIIGAGLLLTQSKK